MANDDINKLMVARAMVNTCDKDGKLLDFNKMYYNYQQKRPMGIVNHFTDYEGFKNIVLKKQLRLTKYTEMNRAGDEGRRIFQQVSIVLEKVKNQLTPDQYEALVEMNDEIKNGNMIRFFRDTNCLEECTPYIVCFSTCSFRNLYKGDYVVSNWLLEKDCCLHMFCDNPELEILEIENIDEDGLMSVNCYNAIEFINIQYNDNVIINHLESTILNYFRMAPDSAIREIRNWIQIARFGILPKGYSHERESRLIVYLPKNLDNHPKIKSYIRCKHTLSKNNEIVGEGKRESDYIYLNFTKNKKVIWGDYNPGSVHKHTIDDYNSIIEKAGFDSLMFDPRWD